MLLSPRSLVACTCLLLTALLPLGACGGPTPEGPGDACEPDGDPCPDGMVCAPGGEDHICQIAPGGGCDPAGPDYCLGDSVCGDDGKGGGVCGIGEGGECDPDASACSSGLACAELQAGGHACYPPVRFEGMVFDAETVAAIEGAGVLALDEQATAVTDVALTDAGGNYILLVPVARDADGAPVTAIFTLRASVDGYQTFPGGLRIALPISTADAVSDSKGWLVQSALTDIALIAVPPDQQGLASIAGTVLADDQSGGVLVVAEAGGKGLSTISDASGAYTIFNVPDGDYTVSGYAADIQLAQATAKVSGAALTGVDLALSADGLGTISGSVNIVNAPGGSLTSVVLVVASTFDDTFVRGEVPRGLRSPLSGPPDVSSSWQISGVPAGSYQVLAAFENDDLVRDPDPNIAGTQIVTVDMPRPGTDVSLTDSFKITEALAVVSPGKDGPEAVSSEPDLVWKDDSSEKFYTVVVYNAYGELVWCRARADILAGCNGSEVPAGNGGDVTVPYQGPLDPGMYYQYRATSWREPGGNPGPIATTEDLRGVFYKAAQ